MEIILALIAIVAVGTLIYVNREARSLDINRDGKVDIDDAKAAVTNTLAAAKTVADVNKDGKVSVADVKAAVKKPAAKKKPAVKKADAPKKTASSGRGRKPKAKKSV